MRNKRQLVIHRHKLVRLRAQVKNELQHLAMNQGVQKKARLWSRAGQKVLRELPLHGWAASRRANLLELMKTMDEQIAELDRAVLEAAEANPQARLLMTQPGVGPVTSLAFVLTIGDVSRFQRGKQVASYLGLIPREHSSAGSGWGRFPSRGIAFCDRRWWKRRRRWCAWTKGFANSINLAATRSRKRWRKWQRHASLPYDSTGCCAPTSGIRRSFTSRVARGCPWPATGRRSE
jgi:transposase